MTSLEFINQNIFEFKNRIEHLENKIIEDKKYPSLVKYHKEHIEELKPILNQLQQIKAKLEAWEVVKNRLEYFREDPSVGVEEGVYQTSKFTPKEIEYIKKALEVENE